MKRPAIKSAVLPIMGGVIALIAVIVAMGSGAPVSKQQVEIAGSPNSYVRFSERVESVMGGKPTPIILNEREANGISAVITELAEEVPSQTDEKSAPGTNERQKPLVLAKNVFPEVQPWVSRTGNLEGSVLRGAGSRVIVTASKQEPGAAGIGLELLVEEDGSDVSEARVEPGHGVEDVTTDEDWVATNQPSSQWNRLSHEEELFRSKWGWNAFNEVKKVLREESD